MRSFGFSGNKITLNRKDFDLAPSSIDDYAKTLVFYANGGGVDEIIMTNEEIIRDNVVNGEIDLDTLIDIIGFEPNYPYQIVGAMKLEKCFLRPYYRIA